MARHAAVGNIPKTPLKSGKPTILNTTARKLQLRVEISGHNGQWQQTQSLNRLSSGYTIGFESLDPSVKPSNQRTAELLMGTTVRQNREERDASVRIGDTHVRSHWPNH